MAETITTISQKDLESLAQKLDELADVLSAKERDLLLTVFKLAGAAIEDKIKSETGDGSQKESGAGVTRVSNTALSDGFKGAFKSVGRGDLSVRSNLEQVAGGVGIGVVY